MNKMKALDQMQEIINSLQSIKGKLELMVFPFIQSHQSSDSHPFKRDSFIEIQSQVQSFVQYCKEQFISIINQKLGEYESKSGHKLSLILSQSNNNVITGQNLKQKKRELTSQSDQNILGAILSPNFKQELNNSHQIGTKYNPFKGSQSNRSYQLSNQSFYTAIQSQNLSDFKYKYLVKHHPQTDSLQQNRIKILNEESLEKFQSMDERSSSRLQGKNLNKGIQTIQKLLRIQKTSQTKIVIKKREKIRSNSKRSSTDVEQALLEIIYGKDLFPFIKFYLNEIKQNSTINTPKSSESSMFEGNIPSRQQQKTIKGKGFLYEITEQDCNPLIKYLTKGNTLEDLTLDQVMEAKFQRLVIICFDTVLYTLKTMSYFMPLGQLNQIICEIERDELNVFKKRCLGYQERDIEKICKKVKKIMKAYRAQMKDENSRRHFFNKNLQIKVQVA